MAQTQAQEAARRAAAQQAAMAVLVSTGDVQAKYQPPRQTTEADGGGIRIGFA